MTKTGFEVRMFDSQLSGEKMSEAMVGIIGGSGLGNLLAEDMVDIERAAVNTPFGEASGKILVGKIGKSKVAFLNRHGDGHKFNPSKVPYRANIYAMKKLGVRSIIATGAVGSLREDIGPGELVIADQAIDKTLKRNNTFFDDYGAVHCEFAEPYCNRLRDKLFGRAGDIDVKVHSKGTYVCMEGPQFSTKAEAMMHRSWGGDLIGMTSMPEAKLARETQMCYALIAMPSDYDCWKEHEAVDKQSLLAEIIGNLNKCTESAIKLIKAVMENGFELCDEKCSCRKSLEMAVWTDGKVIDEKQKEDLKVLFE